MQISEPAGKGFPISTVSPAQDPALAIFATGSGISPIRALIESKSTQPFASVTLYYGAQTQETMAFTDRFSMWESLGVNVIPVLSKDDSAPGMKGYVQTAFAAEPGEVNAAVLCGQKEMAEAVTKMLTEMGVVKDNILMNF